MPRVGESDNDVLDAAPAKAVRRLVQFGALRWTKLTLILIRMLKDVPHERLTGRNFGC